MGNDVSGLCEETLQSVQWTNLDSKDLYVELSSKTFSPRKDLCKKACENCLKSEVLLHLMQKVFEYWNYEYLASNLLHLFKHFILFVYSERIPYSFLFDDSKKSVSTQYENSFHRLVPCSFSFQNLNKTIYISVPQSADFDRAKEQAHMIETIKSHFTEVKDHVLSHNENIYLSDDNGKVIGIEEIYKHYTNTASDTLVDPFKTQTKHFTVFKAHVKTMECDLTSPISTFIKQLVEKLIGEDIKRHVVRTHAVLETLISLLASHLYWLEKPIGRISYSLFKTSPALDILMNLPIETAQMLSRVLLEFSCSHWKVLPKLSIFSTLLSSFLDIRLGEIDYKVGQVALDFLLLLNSSNHSPNPFRIHNWEMKWEGIISALLTHINTFPSLLMFTELMMRNPSFYNSVLSRSDPEAFLEPLLGEVYAVTENTPRLHLILVLLMILSKDKIFIRFINKDAILSNVVWLQEYHIEKISLGSLMVLALVRLIRENLRTKKQDYVHVATISCMLNISSSLTNLHELPSMELVSLCKALFSKYSKLQGKSTSEIGLFADLLHLTIELLCKIMYSGLSSNPYLIQAVLHHSEMFTKIKHSDLVNQNVTSICDCIENCMRNIDSENVLESILCTSKVYQFGECSNDILQCREFIFVEHGQKWEEFVVPYVWQEITKDLVAVPNISRVVLFRHN